MAADEATESFKEPICFKNPACVPVERLRFSNPDLKIVVGDGDEQKTYECYSQIMAMYSGYIDTALAIPMREHETRTLTFPEIHPDEWEKMMHYLQQGASDPECVGDIRVVLPWYDKYDFVAGLELCDRILGQVISPQIVVASNLDESTAAMELLYLYAHRMTASTMEKAKDLLLELLQSCLEGCHSFERGHICQLVPALRTDDDAWSYTKDRILRCILDDGDREKYLDSMAFPDLVLTCVQAHLTLSQARAMEKALVSLGTNLRVEVSTPGGGTADGVYARYLTFWQLQCMRIVFDAASGWRIRRQNGNRQWSTLYVCSERPFNELLPPKTGWRAKNPTNPPQPAPILRYHVLT